jgi:VWFA-related protein
MTAANKETVNARLGEMINRLRSRYSLGYISTNLDFNGKFRHIRLSLTAEAKKRLSGELTINSKQGYFATDRELEELAESAPDPATPENTPAPRNESPPASKSGVTSANPDSNVPVAARPDAPDPASPPRSETKPASPPQPEKVTPLDDPLGDPVARPFAHLVMLDVLATNKKTGAMVKNLGKDDFEIEANGVRQPIQHFSRGEMPLSLVLLLDVAGNTGYALSSLRRSARHWMSKLNPNDEIALMAFAGRAILVQNFTTDRRLIAGKLRNFAEDARRQDVGAGQNRVGAVYQAAELMDQLANPLSRRIIVVVTDDAKSFEGAKSELVIERVIGAECSVYALVAKSNQPSKKGKVARSIVESAIYSFGNPISFAINLGTRLATEAALNALLKDRNFGRLVARSGGSAAQADGDETTDRLSMLLDYGRNRYVIGFAPQSHVSGKRYQELKLQLTPAARKRAGEVAVRAAEGYFAR